MESCVRYIALLIVGVFINKFVGFEYMIILFLSLLLADTSGINSNIEKIKDKLKGK